MTIIRYKKKQINARSYRQFFFYFSFISETSHTAQMLLQWTRAVPRHSRAQHFGGLYNLSWPTTFILKRAQTQLKPILPKTKTCSATTGVGWISTALSFLCVRSRFESNLFNKQNAHVAEPQYYDFVFSRNSSVIAFGAYNVWMWRICYKGPIELPSDSAKTDRVWGRGRLNAPHILSHVNMELKILPTTRLRIMHIKWE